MLEEKILNTITKYKMIESGDSIVIGVSGGPILCAYCKH